MSGDLEALRAKFSIDALTVAVTATWTWSVRPVQTTLGAGILSLNRACATLGELLPEEGAGLAAMTRTVEQATRRAFDCDGFNYLAFMMNDPQVHIHVLPRYRDSRYFHDRLWLDEPWPKPPRLGWDATLIDGALLAAVRDRLAIWA